MKTIAYGKIVDDLKNQWQEMWHESLDDKFRAEAIAEKDYDVLFVERGTVIFATRDFKPLSLTEILERHKFFDVNSIVQPHPSVGGWGKFARTVIAVQKRPTRKRSVEAKLLCADRRRQMKKGGRGWLHR